MRAPLTAEQRDKAQERSQERYERIYNEVRYEFEIERIREFGYPPRRPGQFPSEGETENAIHAETQRRVELDQRHEAEDRAEYVASGMY